MKTKTTTNSTARWTRRNFLKAGGLTALALGLNAYSPAFLKRRILAAEPESAKKLVFIFQRGGNDGVNTLIPYGDPEYSQTTRPTLYIPQAQALQLTAADFARLHPRMGAMMDIYNHSSLNGIDGPGNLAILHRIGYAGQSQSHFDAQLWWETGMPRPSTYTEEGMLYRQVTKVIDPQGQNSVAAISLSRGQMAALKGQRPLVTLRDPADFSFSGSASRVQKLLGELPAAPAGPDGKGLLGLYGGPRDFSGKPYRDLVYGTGLTLADAMNIVQDAVALGPYQPQAPAVYPDNSFGNALQRVAMLLKRTPVQVLGVNIGGWDTHSNQGGGNGNQGNLLQRVAQGFQALYWDLQDQWEDLVIVTMTEFGRTSKENASRGTDHAYACVMFVGGGGVKGGVYNCDPATWAPGDLFSERDRYVRRKTDYRAVFGEIFMKHFGDDMSMINQVIPGYNAAQQANPSDFQFLNFLA
jgi:uncharacterized protein (DUF1501 family)